MNRQPEFFRRAWVIRCLFVVSAIAATFSSAAISPAAGLSEQAASLKNVPADVAFYSASLRLREQWHIFRDSKAYAKLMEIPTLQFAKMYLVSQYQSLQTPPVARFRDYMQSPAGEDAVAVLKDMFGDETFVYGGSEIVESLKLFNDLNALNRSRQFHAKHSDEEDTELANRLIDILDKHSDKFKIPTLVMGFHIKDKDRAKRELDEVHSLLRNLLDEKQPELAAHLQRDQIAGHEFLTLRLDSSMLPWEQIRESAKNLDDDQFDKLKNFIKKHKLAIALGVAGDNVIFSIGESTDHLEKLGSGPKLADQPAIKRLEKHADQRIVSLGYLSKSFAENLGSVNQSINDMANAIDEGLKKENISEDLRKQLAADIRSLDIARYLPQPSEKSLVSFLTPRGYEAFQYSTGKQPAFDSSKPLSILDHVGNNPILVVASRSKQNVKAYDEVVAWLKKIALQIEKIAEEKAKPEDWAKYQDVREKAVALLKRVDQANREHWFPALVDGQCAFVMDVDAKSKQWCEKMPASPNSLPMLEMAFAAGVSDAEHLRQAVKEYISIGLDTYNLVKEVNPRHMPEAKLPKPKVAEIEGDGKLYSYPLPKKWGIDPQLAPNAGLTDKFVAVSTAPKMTERLLGESTPKFDTSFKLDQPAAVFAHFEFAKMIASLRPWIDYGVDVASGKLKLPKKKAAADDEDADKDKPAEPNPFAMQIAFVVPQVTQFLDFASAFRSATSITYQEADLWVTHSELHFQDLK